MPAGETFRQSLLLMDSNQSPGKKSITQGLPTITTVTDFNPCTATASMFLYAQGNSIICAHHDTLAIERRFSKHLENILLLAADTISDRGAGKWVVSYDASNTVIFWNCLTGDELTRFISYDNLTVAAWIQNGSLAFGNVSGDVILFDPITATLTSTHKIYDTPITAIAPAADCKTFAIGFANGSLLISQLIPKFTIMYNLSTEVSLCPITTLAWHASSSRQKSEMLATQSRNGEIRVWSISKHDQQVPSAKIVRIIPCSENHQMGVNWLSWSKNGRIIQFSEGETWSWDVRTKNLTYEPVPTLGHVMGLAIYGSDASLFTLGPNNTVQQFDLNSPPQMVANVQHPPEFSSLTLSAEKKKQQHQYGEHSSGPESLATIPVRQISLEGDNHVKISSLKSVELDMKQRTELKRNEIILTGSESPVSNQSQKSIDSKSSTKFCQKKNTFDSSGARIEGTTIHMSPSWHSSHGTLFGSSRDNLSISSMGSRSDNSASVQSPSYRTLRKVMMTTSETKLNNDIFTFTRKRLEKNLTSSSSRVLQTDYLSNQDCRRQMFRIIFGWNGEAHELIQDEINRHKPRSSTRLLLAKWLGKIDSESITPNLESMNSSDWMLLALNSIGRHTLQVNLSQGYVQRLLGAGDIHTAATIMIGMGDPDDAIEVYISHKSYMEAIILTCLVFPDDWLKQAQLIQRWGELAIQCGQKILAGRCLDCIGVEYSEVCFPAPAQDSVLSLPQNNQIIPNILSPPLSPPELSGPQRNHVRAIPLKLDTSVSNQATSKYSFSRMDENIGSPILSALSPTSTEIAQTAFIRQDQRSAYHTPASARTVTPNGFKRQYIPYFNNAAPDFFSQNMPLSNSISSPVIELEREKDEETESIAFQSKMTTNQMNSTPVIERAALTSPMIERPRKFLKSPLPLPSPPESFSPTTKPFDLRTRNCSLNHKPQDLEIDWPLLDSIITGDYMTSSDSSVDSSRSGTLNRSLTKSYTTSTRLESYEKYSSIDQQISHGHDNTETMGLVNKSLDDYISSLESNQPHEDKKETVKEYEARSSSKEIDMRGPDKPPNVRLMGSSSSSPVSRPLHNSHDNRIICKSSGQNAEIFPEEDTRENIPPCYRLPLGKSYSRPSEDQTSSPSRKISARRLASSKQSRKPSLDHDLILNDNERGRSPSRKGSLKCSPSPLKFSRQYSCEIRKNSGDNLQQTSLEYMPCSLPRKTSSNRAHKEKFQDLDINCKFSIDRNGIEDCESQGKNEPLTLFQREILHRRTVSDANIGGTRSLMNDRNLRKEKAARELEERRKSLARRPSVPLIIHPKELEKLSPAHYRTPPPSGEFMSRMTPEIHPPDKTLVSCSHHTVFEEEKKKKIWTGIQIGLPATPKAMKILKSHPSEGMNSFKLSTWSTGKHEMVQSFSADYQNSTFQTNGFENLTILPSTTYKATASIPSRRMPPRSASAPIPEEPFKSPQALPSDLPTHPAFQVALPPSSGSRTADPNTNSSQWQSRKVSPGESRPGTLGYEIRNNQAAHSRALKGMMSGIEETMETTPPSSPMMETASPPLLKELQHLARPPPPPTPPPPPEHVIRLENPNTNSIVSGISSGSGIIEIVRDDQDEQCADQKPSETRNFSVSPSLSTKQSFNSGNHHGHGRSEKDYNISGRLIRLNGRLRSVSRGQGIIHSSSPLEAKHGTISMPIRSANNSPVGNINYVGGNGNLAHHKNISVNQPLVVSSGIEGGMI